MNLEPGAKVKSRIFYGWWIVLAGFVVIAYGMGAQDYLFQGIQSFGEELGGSVSQSARGMTVFSIVGFIALFAIGPLIDRYGPKKLMLLGILVAGSGFMALGFVHSLFSLYMFLGMLGIGMSAGFLLPVQTATANWFLKRRSIALAVICAAPFLGNTIVILFESRITGQVDLFKSACLVLGLVMLLLCIPLALVIKHKPEQLYSVSDGAEPTIKETEQPEIVKTAYLEEVNYSLRQALRTKAFWILTVAIGLGNGAGAMAVIFRIIYLGERGFDLSTTPNFIELSSLMGLVGILLFGFLGDKYPKRYLLSIAVSLQSISVVVLMVVGNMAPLYLYMLVLGFSSGIVPLILAIRADYFGRKAYATITVVMGFISSILTFGLSTLGTLVFVVTHTFPPVFLISIFIGFIAAIVFYFARPPEPPRQESTLMP